MDSPLKQTTKPATKGEETDFVAQVTSNQRLMRIVKFSLSNLIKKLIDDVEFDRTSFFSDNVHRFGNIGVPKSGTDLETKLSYLTSPESTVREKVTAITNSLVNGADPEKKNQQNTKKLFEYMRKLHSAKLASRWVQNRLEYVTSLLSSSDVRVDSTHMWAPIYLLYPSYRTKYDLTKTKLKKEDQFDPDVDGVSPYELPEPLSDLEQQFLMNCYPNRCSTGLTARPSNRMCHVPGRYLYSDIKSILPESKHRHDDLIVGGVSGHTILFMELALVMDVKWEPIVFACVVSQFPLHHSLIEIVDALREIGLVHSSRERSHEVNQITTLKKVAEGLGIYI
ncbi:hypothetical protein YASMINEVIRUS_851 [Yasminevirus sp. GU-2018]|uniref:Uncharacterized protein n=1 Tax=Yasminevirus sp. GU-2018 TaxID=2420051 RepID=A0A5K0U8K1_9VIRU|nr:hypothetical protein YASMINEVIRUS_851 [Yasminevirus sp. GU-2018]